MPESYYVYGICGVVVLIPMLAYVFMQARRDRLARDAAAHSQLVNTGPRAQHPHIDATNCIGCQGCTMVCPEGDVLGMVGGKAAVIKPYKCIGHGLCADACPVGAIELRLAGPSVSADLPFLTPEYETSLPNLFIAGELGGLALIRNAVVQGRECAQTIARRIRAGELGGAKEPGLYDVVIIGAGPAGISATLQAMEDGLRYATIERESLGGAIFNYPRQKLVMTRPLDFAVVGRFEKKELSKENLMALLSRIAESEGFQVQLEETVELIHKGEDAIFTVRTSKREYRGLSVVLAMGRAGTPRKLGVPGEQLPKVMYRLIEADHYINKKVLIVGGGDSAIEAALGLACQRGNQVTISYRRDAFVRIKERNSRHLDEAVRAGKIKVIFDSGPVEIRPDTVILSVGGVPRELPNDLVWVFAGGVAPNDFLKKIGVHFGNRDLTIEAVKEAAAAE